MTMTKYQTNPETGYLRQVRIKITDRMLPLPAVFKIMESLCPHDGRRYLSTDHDIVDITHGVDGLFVTCLLREGRTQEELESVILSAGGNVPYNLSLPAQAEAPLCVQTVQDAIAQDSAAVQEQE